jgi:hypothetical protein
VFDMLFAAASETLLELGRDPRWLGARLGITAVLHTWTRELVFHPHLHCIVTGGGLTPDGTAWRSCRRDFLLPVRVMGALFRGKLLAKLRDARGRGELGQASDAEAFARLLDRLHRTNWVVYAKRPFGGAEQVVRYLGRYTHRIGIRNQRLVSLERHAAQAVSSEDLWSPTRGLRRRLHDHPVRERLLVPAATPSGCAAVCPAIGSARLGRAAAGCRPPCAAPTWLH